MPSGRAKGLRERRLVLVLPLLARAEEAHADLEEAAAGEAQQGATAGNAQGYLFFVARDVLEGNSEYTY